MEEKDPRSFEDLFQENRVIEIYKKSGEFRFKMRLKIRRDPSAEEILQELK